MSFELKIMIEKPVDKTRKRKKISFSKLTSDIINKLRNKKSVLKFKNIKLKKIFIK